MWVQITTMKNTESQEFPSSRETTELSSKLLQLEVQKAPLLYPVATQNLLALHETLVQSQERVSQATFGLG